MIHKRGWTERDEIEILDLNLHSRMNSNVYKIEKGEFSHLEFWKYIFRQREPRKNQAKCCEVSNQRPCQISSANALVPFLPYMMLFLSRYLWEPKQSQTGCKKASRTPWRPTRCRTSSSTRRCWSWTSCGSRPSTGSRSCSWSRATGRQSSTRSSQSTSSSWTNSTIHRWICIYAMYIMHMQCILCIICNVSKLAIQFCHLAPALLM